MKLTSFKNNCLKRRQMLDGREEISSSCCADATHLVGWCPKSYHLESRVNELQNLTDLISFDQVFFLVVNMLKRSKERQRKARHTEELQRQLAQAAEDPKIEPQCHRSILYTIHVKMLIL